MDELPDELRQLEEELTASRSHDVPPDLRDRVLREVRHGLATELRASPWQGRWAFAASVAASVLVWMNVSISATTATADRVRLATAPAVDRLAADIRELLPDLPIEEVRRQAVLHGASNAVALRPELPPPSIKQEPHNAPEQVSE